MLSIDPPEARKLFERMSPRQIPSLACSDALIPNVHVYFQTAGALAKRGFSPQEQQKREHVQFLRGVILAIASPIEVEPAAQMLLSQQLRPEELTSLVGLYAQRLETIVPDNRAFFANLEAAGEQAMKLADEIVGTGPGLALLKGWRTYLVTNLRSARCEETGDPAFVYARWSTKVVEGFNRRARAIGSPLSAIESEEVRPDKVIAGLGNDAVSRSPQDEDLSKQWFALMFGDQRQSLSDEKKNTSEWKALFSAFINSVESLEPPPGESSTDLIRHKCELLSQAVMAAPPGLDRDKVLDRYVSLLNVSNIQPELVSEWYNEIRNFIRLSQALANSGTPVAQKLREKGNSLISLVASIDELELR
ncbi:MAG: hypothetical protein JWO80_3506 [Bryobacterales bacterium]|nr:hypothetical protein [Bryobacterales bacterium]